MSITVLGMARELPPAVVFMGSLALRRSVFVDSMDFLTSVRNSSGLVLSLWGQSPLYPHYASEVARLACRRVGKGWHSWTWKHAHAHKLRTHVNCVVWLFHFDKHFYRIMCIYQNNTNLATLQDGAFASVLCGTIRLITF